MLKAAGYGLESIRGMRKGESESISGLMFPGVRLTKMVFTVVGFI
jgi:hypothetical protein